MLFVNVALLRWRFMKHILIISNNLAMFQYKLVKKNFVVIPRRYIKNIFVLNLIWPKDKVVSNIMKILFKGYIFIVCVNS